MEKNILIENSLTILKLKSILFDIISEEMAKQNNRVDIITNILKKSTELLQEIEKLSFNSTPTKTPEITVEASKNIPAEKTKPISEPTNTSEPKNVQQETVTEPKKIENKDMPTPKPNFKEETIKVKNEAIPAKELKEEKSEPIKQPESSSELKEDNQSLSLPDLPPIVDIDDDKKEKNSIVFDNNESPLEKTIKENKEEPVKTSPNIPKEEKRVYPKVSLHKDSDDPPRAIIVTVSQFKNLQQSKVKKKNEIIENELSEEEPKIEEKPTEEDEILPVINIDNNIADIKDITGNQEDTSTTEEIISNNKVIEEKSTPEEKNNQIIEETPKDDVEESIEQMLERANNLYKEGKLQESQALYEKISNLNKAKQNEDKVYVKTA